MPIPQVTDRIKEAPAVALRAVFAGIGQLLMAVDKIRAQMQEQATSSAPASQQRPGAGQPPPARADGTGTVLRERAAPATKPPAGPAETKPDTATKPAAGAKAAAGTKPATGAKPATGTKAAAGTKPATGAKPPARAAAGTKPAAGGTKPGAAAKAAAATKPAANAAAGTKPGATAKAAGTKPGADATKPAGARPGAATVKPAAGAKPGAAAAKLDATTKPPASAKPAASPAARKPAAATPAAPAAVQAAPIPGYDDLSVASLRARLRGLDAAGVQALLDYEKANAHRDDVITMFERRLSKIENGAS
jgi:hypothetical protein